MLSKAGISYGFGFSGFSSHPLFFLYRTIQLLSVKQLLVHPSSLSPIVLPISHHPFVTRVEAKVENYDK